MKKNKALKTLLALIFTIILISQSFTPAQAGVANVGGNATGGPSGSGSEASFTAFLSGLRVGIGCMPSGKYMQGYLII